MVGRCFRPVTKGWTRAVRILLISAGLAGLGACTTIHRIDPFKSAAPQSSVAAPHPAPSAVQSSPLALPKGCADEKCAKRAVAAHRQYFDQRHKRYYFYDPARRAYYWEDGTPKS